MKKVRYFSSLDERIKHIYTLANDACKSGNRTEYYKYIDILKGILIALEYLPSDLSPNDIKMNMNLIEMYWSYCNE